MSKQIKDLILEIQQLKTENKALTTENQKIKQKLQVLENNIDQKIAQTIKQATQPLIEQINQLENQNTQKNNEILRLKTQLNKNSTNSSNPPSTNKRRIIHNNREKTNRKPGGQPGHKGTTLTIPKNLDELVKEGKAQKRTVDLTGGAKKYISKWQIDIETTVVYTQYRYPTTEIPQVYYGENIKALTVLLTNHGLITENRLCDIFRDISYGLITISDATIEKFNQKAAEAVDIEAIKTDLLNGEIMHVDEIVVDCVERLEYSQVVPQVAVNSSFDAVIRTHSNATSTLYTVNPHKDDEGVRRDGILGAFVGVLVHDHDKKYYKYGALHATCGSHLSRNLKGLGEFEGVGGWAERFRRFYVGMHVYKECCGRRVCGAVSLLLFERRYDCLLVEGEAVLEGLHPKGLAFRELSAMIDRLRTYKDAYMLFMRDFRVPFTNNLAERDFRLCKTQQKVSGCFRSWGGLVCFATLRSFISTARKRNQPLLPAVKMLFAKPVHIAG